MSSSVQAHTTPRSAKATLPPNDPIKDAILSASGSGWTPLRIGKRDEPGSPQSSSARKPTTAPVPEHTIARRQSSSYIHVHTNNLVSNSPFKNPDPGNAPLGARFRPAPQYQGIAQTQRLAPYAQGTKPSRERKVSGERKVSAERRAAKSHENARPSPLTPAPHKTSKAYRPREHVQRPPLVEMQDTVRDDPADVLDIAVDGTDSDELTLPDEADEPTLVHLPRPATPPHKAAPDSLSGASRKQFPTSLSRLPPSASSPATKSNLVSKRLIGPRSISGSSIDSTGRPRRRRRKTVTFDPRCDVVEFSADEADDDIEYEDEEYDDDEGDESMDFEGNDSISRELDGFVTGVIANIPGTPTGHETSAQDMEYLTARHRNISATSSTNMSLSTLEPTSPVLTERDLDSPVFTERDFHSPVLTERNLHSPVSVARRSPMPGPQPRDSGYAEHFDGSEGTPTKADRRISMDEDSVLGDHLDGDRVSSPGPRISRIDVMRRLEARRAGSSSPQPPTPTDADRVATPSPLHSPSIRRPALRTDKPLPIAPGPPLIAVPNHEKEGERSFSESLGLGSEEEEAGDEADTVENLLRGVERDMGLGLDRLLPVSSSTAQTPILDSATEEDDSILSAPTTPFTPPDDMSEAYEHSKPQTELFHHSYEPQVHESTYAEDTTEDESAARASTEQTSHFRRRSGTTELLALPGPDIGDGWGVVDPASPQSSAFAARSPSPSKIAQRAASIRQKKREKRSSEGRPKHRRVVSADDVEDTEDGPSLSLMWPLRYAAEASTALLSPQEPLLADSIDAELRRRLPKDQRPKYRLREAASVVYAADDKVSNVGQAGDVDSGRAWKMIRRPSDMNEYSRQMREIRAQDSASKALGKVFVRVVGIKGLNVPVPPQPTLFTCTLYNGIHFVTTPECKLAKDCNVDQEFELIEHPKLEFTLTIKVKKDAHLLPVAAPASTSTTTRPPAHSHSSSQSKVAGVLAFFGQSKKSSQKTGRAGSPAAQPPTSSAAAQAAAAQPQLPEGLARHLKTDGTLGRVFISFADVASRCDTKLFETGLPLVGTKPGTTGEAVVLGELVVQMFRLPPLPGVSNDKLPQSLDDCHRGLRHVSWHKMTYFEGTLTQLGGDCQSWRRRHFRVIGGSLVAYNDVTKKVTTKIDLRYATAIIDEDDVGRKHRDSGDALCGVERAFRLSFRGSRDLRDEDISFYADTDEDKEKWLNILRALVGHVPPYPLWGELVWQQQQEAAGITPTASSLSLSAASPSNSQIPAPTQTGQPVRRPR
ncbi:hypothetical protein BKA62DRAFT_617870 [Auriculariales sp. MPI-PUGE-AT-0066]|nr:hypothetical protein BKA62DRAFT_617870 [Auriculariales sp. MPI-PUGE-AT-0066]